MSSLPRGCSLGMVMIARDEGRCIERALRSVRAHVDRMVVVDTGSRDSTPSLASACGADVIHMDWSDDFSAAKNRALDACGTDWTLVLDADEWIMEGGALLRRWARDRKGVPSFGVVSCTSATDAAGSLQYVTDDLIRVLPAGARFEGRVHEQPSGEFPVARTGVRLGHDGYLEAQLTRKRGRNEMLIRAELQERDDDGYMWYQLGCALAVDGRHVEACEAFAQALPLVGAESPQRHPLVVRYLFSLGQASRHEAAFSLFTREATMWSESPDLHFVMADVLLGFGVVRPDRAAAVVPAIRALLERALEIGERTDLPGAVAGRGSTFARRNLELLVGDAVLDGRG